MSYGLDGFDTHYLIWIILLEFLIVSDIYKKPNKLNLWLLMFVFTMKEIHLNHIICIAGIQKLINELIWGLASMYLGISVDIMRFWLGFVKVLLLCEGYARITNVLTILNYMLTCGTKLFCHTILLKIISNKPFHTLTRKYIYSKQWINKHTLPVFS